MTTKADGRLKGEPVTRQRLSPKSEGNTLKNGHRRADKMATDTVAVIDKAAAKQASYNGWPNYQTWNVMLWMDNEESAYREYRSKVERYRSKGRRFTSAAAQAVCIECLGEQTPDGVKVTGTKVRWGAIAEAMREQ